MIDTSAIDVWLVDGFNALHACLLKGRERERWWGAEAQIRVVQWLDAFASDRRVVVVFDASHEHSERCSNEGFSTTVCFAPDADDEIVRLTLALPGQVCVVTADRSLSDRCRARGAQTLKPWAFDASMAGAEIADRMRCSEDSS